MGCVRSCAACRTRAPRHALLRFVAVDGQVVFDIDKRLGGRGLNLGPSPGCLAQAHKRGVFQRQWKLGVSKEDLEVLVLGVRQSLAERLHHWMRDGLQRRVLAPVALDALSPATRVLWDDARLCDVVAGVPPIAASTPRAAMRMALLAHAVSQFTFVGTGDKKRRPEPADACSALAPDMGLAAAGLAEAHTAAAASLPGHGDSFRPVLSAGEGLVPLLGHPSGGSE